MSIRPFFFLLLILIPNLNNCATITPPITPSKSLTTTPFPLSAIAQDIDKFLRLGYRQLSAAYLANIQTEHNNYLLAYLVPNGSVFIFNTEYIPEKYSIKIIGVLELTGLNEEVAAGIRRASSPPIQKKQQLVSQNRTLLSSNSKSIYSETNSQTAKKRSFLESMADFDYDTKENKRSETSSRGK